MKSVKETVKFARLINPGKGAGAGGAISTGNTASGGSNYVDTQGFQEVLFRLIATGKSAASKTLAISIRECDTATGTYTAITDGIGDSATAAFGTIGIASGTQTQGTLRLNLTNRKRYLKAYKVVTGSGALYQVSLDAVLANPFVAQPITQTSLTTAT